VAGAGGGNETEAVGKGHAGGEQFTEGEEAGVFVVGEFVARASGRLDDNVEVAGLFIEGGERAGFHGNGKLSRFGGCCNGGEVRRQIAGRRNLDLRSPSPRPSPRGEGETRSCFLAVDCFELNPAQRTIE